MAYSLSKQEVVVASPGLVTVFEGSNYMGKVTQLGVPVTNETSASSFLNTTTISGILPSTFSSIYVPAGSYIRYSSSSGIPTILQGSVPNTAQWPSSNSLSFFPPNSNITFGFTLCPSGCSSGGTCLSSIQILLSNGKTPSFADLDPNNANYQCICMKGFAGKDCSACEEGYFGRGCEKCKDECGTCDDGVQGTGGCLSPRGNSTTCELNLPCFAVVLLRA